jgi:hypothetical protein
MTSLGRDAADTTDTACSCRYRSNATSKGRIFDGMSSQQDANQASGFYKGRAGVAYHGRYITAQQDSHGDSWVLSCDRHWSYRSNRVDRTLGGALRGC